MGKPDFVHLHVYSDLTFGRSIARIGSILDACKAAGMGVIALTDHGVLAGAVEFQKQAAERGIRPILGCGFFLPGGAHLTLLAEDETGWRNLCALSTAACRLWDGRATLRAEIGFDLLQKHRAGLIAFSTCVGAKEAGTPLPLEFLAAPEHDRPLPAEDGAPDTGAARRLLGIFGRDRFRIELPARCVEQNSDQVTRLSALSRKLRVPLLATGEVRCVRKEDASALAALPGGAPGMSASGFHFRSPVEMETLFREHPAPLLETVRIADRCSFRLAGRARSTPAFRHESGLPDDALLRHLCEEGARQRYGLHVPKEVRERLEEEIRTIIGSGLSRCYLEAWDLARFARENGIPMGPGRGTAPGSLVNYCLRITAVDPIRNGLLFELFLNHLRAWSPEYFLDFARSDRPRLLGYLRKRHGTGSIIGVSVIDSLSSKAAIRSASRSLNAPDEQKFMLLSMVREGWSNWSGAGIRGEAYAADFRLLVDTAHTLQGSAASFRPNDALFAIGEGSLLGSVPLWGEGENAWVQFTDDDLEWLGFRTIYISGLATLDRLSRVHRLVEDAEGKRIDLDKNEARYFRTKTGALIHLDGLPLDDPAVFELARTGNTWGIFEWEKDSMRRLLMRIKPGCFEDLAAAQALDRPGPMESGRTEDFIRRRMARPRSPGHRLLMRFLEGTRGMILYREQVLRIAVELAGFPMKDALKFWRSLALARWHGRPGKLEQEKPRFIAGIAAKGTAKRTAADAYAWVEHAAPYTFLKSHAVGWTLLSYRMAWLKAHWPEEFNEAMMRAEGEACW